MCSIVELVREAWQNPLGPGFESQVPQNFVIFFLQGFMCISPGVDHHTPPDLKGYVATKADPMAQDRDSSYSLVNKRTLDHRKSSRLIGFGPEYW